VQDPLLVGGRKSGAELSPDPDRLVGGESADAPQQRSQVLPVHIFHGQEVSSFVLGDVVHAADVRVGDLSRDADLPEEAGPQGLVILESGG